MFEANFDPWESVASILKHPGEWAHRLRAHILKTKLMYWQLIATHLKLEQPPKTLLELMQFECKVTGLLTFQQPEVVIEYSGRG